jgi:long-chain-fatty-acid--CoA ligase ACSBG
VVGVDTFLKFNKIFIAIILAKVSPDKIKQLLGLGECHALFSGAAPIKRSTLNFFLQFNIQILEVFGMSESAGPHTVGFSYHNLIGSVGYCRSEFNRTKIINPDADGNGEVCMYGRHVFMGYLNSEKKTEETIDSDGWLLTGDIGKVDQYDFLYITGRLKELLITAGGENISPVPIEEAIIAHQPDLISNCMVVGDQKSYLTVLVALKSKLDSNTTASLDELSDEAVSWLKRNGSFNTKVSEIQANGDQVVNNGIQSAIDKANEKSISNAAKVRKFTILPRDFSLATGELGPTLKLRRPIVHKMYENIIEKMYQ